MYRPPPGRYSYGGPEERERYQPRDGPERPGYYAGSKPYRLDVRNAPRDEGRRAPSRGGFPRGHQESLTGHTPDDRGHRIIRGKPRGGGDRGRGQNWA